MGDSVDGVAVPGLENGLLIVSMMWRYLGAGACRLIVVLAADDREARR